MLSSSRSKERKEGQELIRSIFNSRSDVYTIHYSCESFDKTQSGTPRITSISLYNLLTGEQRAYSIHVEAHRKQYDVQLLSKVELDASERALLNKFYKFVKENQGCLWVHWNMKNSKYGFDALSNRYEILTRRTAPPVRIHLRYDLSLLLKKLYGHNYVAKVHNSKLLNLALRNSFPCRNMLTGEQEADAFNKRKFLTLVASSQEKAEAIGVITKAISNKQLKVDATFREIYGINVLGTALFLGDNYYKINKIVSAVSRLSSMLFT